MRELGVRLAIPLAMTIAGCCRKAPPAEAPPQQMNAVRTESEPRRSNIPAGYGTSMDAIVATELNRNCFGDPKAVLRTPATTATTRQLN